MNYINFRGFYTITGIIKSNKIISFFYIFHDLYFEFKIVYVLLFIFFLFLLTLQLLFPMILKSYFHSNQILVHHVHQFQILNFKESKLHKTTENVF